MRSSTSRTNVGSSGRISMRRASTSGFSSAQRGVDHAGVAEVPEEVDREVAQARARPQHLEAPEVGEDEQGAAPARPQRAEVLLAVERQRERRRDAPGEEEPVEGDPGEAEDVAVDVAEGGAPVQAREVVARGAAHGGVEEDVPGRDEGEHRAGGAPPEHRRQHDDEPDAEHGPLLGHLVPARPRAHRRRPERLRPVRTRSSARGAQAGVAPADLDVVAEHPEVRDAALLRGEVADPRREVHRAAPEPDHPHRDLGVELHAVGAGAGAERGVDRVDAEAAQRIRDDPAAGLEVGPEPAHEAPPQRAPGGAVASNTGLPRTSASGSVARRPRGSAGCPRCRAGRPRRSGARA